MINMAEVSPWIDLGSQLIKMGIEYASASAARRAELISEADDAYEACKATMLSLGEAVAANNAAADAIAEKKPEEAPSPTVVVEREEETKP